MEKHIAAVSEWALTFIAGLTPAAFGAAVALAYEKGLTWTERFTQFAVGVCVSYYTTRLVGGVFLLDAFVIQGISFSVGMIAFKAAPRFISGAADALGGFPGALRDRVLDLFPKRKEGK